MIAKEFIIEQINQLVEKFPYLQARYEVDIFSKSHYIEISPKTFYQTDKLYMAEEQSILIHFIEKYPYESITFLTTDDLLTIENPVYSKKGWMFGLSELSFNNTLLNFDSPQYIKKEPIRCADIFFDTIQSRGYDMLNDIKFEFINQSNFKHVNYHSEEKNKTEVVDNYKYAMAA